MSADPKDTLKRLKEGAARGGAAARGEKKRRTMTGVSPSRGSAGRSNALGGGWSRR